MNLVKVPSSVSNDIVLLLQAELVPGPTLSLASPY